MHSILRFSIIVPVHNVEEYLAECIDSILVQDYVDFEILLVDDGSTDGSSAICDHYARSQAGKIRLIRQRNSGLLMARRVGFRAARGDILMTVDADDFLRRDALSLIDAVFTAHDVDLVIFGHSRKKPFAFTGGSPFDSSRLLVGDEGMHVLRRRFCVSSSLDQLWMKAAKRKILDLDADYSEFFGLSNGEDILQTLHIFDGRLNAFYLHEVIYHYRINNRGITRTYSEEKRSAIPRVCRERMAYASKWATLHHDSLMLTGTNARNAADWAHYCQLAAEELCVSEAMRAIREVAAGEGFSEAYADRAAHRMMRFDFRLIAFLIGKEMPCLVLVVCRLKRFFRKVLSK